MIFRPDGILCSLLLIAFAQDSNCLVLTKLSVPEFVLEGGGARLVCLYRLGPSENLYTVKWYKSGNEFYRFVPRETPQVQVFPVPGVYVNLAESNRSVVSLLVADSDTSGRYRCEVSAEAPSFDTQSDYADLLVVVLPKSGPSIVGGKQRYRPGDAVQVTCKAAPSRPAQSLAWFVNGEHANKSYLRGPVVRGTSEGLESSELGLNFRLKESHFTREGLLRLKCSATIATVYWVSREEEAASGALVPKEPRPPLSSRADRVLSSSNEANSGSSPRSSTFFLSGFFVILMIQSLCR